MPTRIRIGSTDLSALIPYIEQAKELMHQVEALRDLKPNRTNELTARFTDINQPAGHRPYFVASGYLNNAHEHSDAFMALIRSDHGLTPRAPWTLLRSVFESGFYATWVLESRDSRTRRVRGLRMELINERERNAWIRELQLSPEAEKKALDREGTKSYQAECRALRLDFKTAGAKLNVVDSLKALSFATSMDPPMGAVYAATWRSLSGNQHSLPYALLHSSDIADRIVTDGGEVVQLSVNDDVLLFVAKLSYSLLLEGARLFIRRSTEPLSPTS